jgi:putative nucleotidyltransferase with HDIG domain
LDKSIRDQIGQRIKDIPTLPVVAAKILEVTENPESSVEDLKEIIMMDQVVSARLLKAVNSAFFGFPRKIDTISQAIVILGFNNVRSLALSVSILAAMPKTPSKTGFDYRTFWRHAAGTAFVARAMAKSVRSRDSELFFVAGLLHDIGFIPLEQGMPEDLKKAQQLSQERQIPLYMAEMEVLGFTHADVGCFIAEKWLLPGTLKEPIARHHTPAGELEFAQLTHAVHAADVICKIREYGGYGDNALLQIEDIHESARKMFKIQDNLPREAEEFLSDDMAGASDFFTLFE